MPGTQREVSIRNDRGEGTMQMIEQVSVAVHGAFESERGGCCMEINFSAAK
jgi:hypothetical protein